LLWKNLKETMAMSISTICPECKALFRLAEKLAGKRVKCLKCQALFIVPGADTTETQMGIRVRRAEDAETETEAADNSTSVATKVSLPPPPKKRNKEIEEPEEEERFEDGDEPEEKPRRVKKKRKKKGASDGSMTLALMLIGAAVLCLVMCGGVGTVGYLVAFRGAPGQVADGGDRLPAPVGGAFPITLNANGAFHVNTVLTNRDPLRDRRHTKTFSIRMEAGKTYEINMISDDIDCYLFLLDENGGVLSQDDDGGDGLDSRIVFTPPRTATYRIEATSFVERERGNFELSIRRF
jgi:predicted Zn finger-like uncharacterized protein